YYYRRQINDSWWTPWEKVNVDIAGEHLIPVVFNRRLYLFWPIFINEADEKQKVKEKPHVHWKIQLAWSHFKNGRWSPKKIVTEPTIRNNYFEEKTAFPRPASYSFHATKEDGNIVIRCYHRGDTYGDSYIVDTSGKNKRLDEQFCFTNDEVVILQSATGQTDDIEAQPYCAYDAMLQSSNPENALNVSGKILKLYENSGDLDDTQVVFNKESDKPYSILAPHQYGQFATQAMFFFQDGKRTFIVKPSGGRQRAAMR
ncbi:MAG: hypothetical protein IPK53_08170, partial [bacterium]|nr:hypothetical protein [bacterium]